MRPRAIIEKIWDSHVVSQQPGAPALMYVDLHLVHEVTSPQAFAGLRERGLKVRRPDLTIATTDHSTPTTPRGLPILDKIAATQVAQLSQASALRQEPQPWTREQESLEFHVSLPAQSVTAITIEFA